MRAAPLRGVLSRAAALREFDSPSNEWVDSTAGRISWFMPGADEGERRRTAEVVLPILLDEYIKALDPSAATAATHRMLSEQVSAAGTSIRSDVREVRDSLLQRYAEKETFEQRLLSLPPLNATQAAALRSSWPEVERTVAELCLAADRGTALADWTSTEIDWLTGAPSSAFTWLASLSNAYGRPEAAAAWLKRAVAHGVTPQAYWRARAAYAISATEGRAAGLEFLAENPSEHPLARLVRMDDGLVDEAQVQAALEAWQPISHEDSAFKLLNESRAAARRGDLAKAIELAQRAYRDFGSSGGAITAAEFLQARAAQGTTADRLADFQRSLALSIDARDQRRRWRGDSAQPVHLAVNACRMLGDFELAWRLVRLPPEGEANESEVADARVLADACMAAAFLDRNDVVEELRPQISNPFAAGEIDAYLAVREDRTEDAIRAWESASVHATDPAMRLRAAMGLSRLGADFPDISDLAHDYADEVREVQLAQTIARDPGNLALLRASVAVSPAIALRLAETYEEQGEVGAAAKTLVEAGDRWHDATLYNMGARTFLKAGMLAEARDAVSKAVAKGADWPGIERTYVLQIEIEAALGAWDAATDAARNLVRRRPTDPDAIWALVRCLLQRGSFDEAWQALTANGGPASPRGREETSAWVYLGATFSTDEHFLSTALDVLKPWVNDEGLMAECIGHLVSHLTAPGRTIDDEDSAAFHAAVADFTTKFPQSSGFRVIHFSEDEDPRQRLAAEVPKPPEELREVERRAAAGELPIGLYSEAFGRSYAEALIGRASGMLLAVRDGEDGTAALLEALDMGCVADVSAIVLVEIIRRGADHELVGHFPALYSTDLQFHDAQRAARALSAPIAGHAAIDDANGTLSFRPLDSGTAKSLAERATAVSDLVKAMVRRPVSTTAELGELGVPDAPWLSAVALAKRENLPLWADDALLRSLAISVDVACFGTWDVIKWLEAHGELTAAERQLIEATLIHNYIAEFPFDKEVWDLAAELDAWHARGAAASLTRPAVWTTPERVVEFGLAAVARQAKQNPLEARAWLTALSVGLCRIAGSSQDATNNLAILLRRCLIQTWATPEFMPLLLGGVRAGLGEVPDIAADPLPTVLGPLLGDLARAHGHASAAAILLAVFSLCDAADQQVAARTILTS